MTTDRNNKYTPNLHILLDTIAHSSRVKRNGDSSSREDGMFIYLDCLPLATTCQTTLIRQEVGKEETNHYTTLQIIRLTYDVNISLHSGLVCLLSGFQRVGCPSLRSGRGALGMSYIQYSRH